MGLSASNLGIMMSNQFVINKIRALRLAALVGVDANHVEAVYAAIRTERKRLELRPESNSNTAVAIEDVKGLIMNPYKHLVRNDIINQARIVSKQCQDQGKTFKCMTLPGTNFVFEQTLTRTLGYESVPAAFDCFETHPQRFKFACKEGVPLNVNFKFADFTDNATRPAGTTPGYNLIWADYCCTAGLDIIKSLVTAVKSWSPERDTLVYASFCLSRKNSTRLISELGYKRKSLIESISAAFMKGFAQRSLDVKRIYSTAYPGGKSAKTPMVTVGFQIRPTIKVPPIEDEMRFNLRNKGLRRISCAARHRHIDVKSTTRSKLDAYLTTYYNRYGSGYVDLNDAKRDKKFRSGYIHSAMRKFGVTHHQPTGMVIPQNK